MALSVDQLINEVAMSGLVPAADLLAWLSAMPEAKRPKTGEELARELVQQKKLTKFQAEQIFAGQGKSLTLGNYLILDKLGQGGMGVVLKAMHLRMERIVALKVMSQAGMKSPDAVQRFHREVKAAAKLHHPNIVTAFDADEANGTHFLVMEYIEGTDLSALVKKHGPLSIEQAVQYLLQAARGLEFAHSCGVIHRDIKPSNLLVCSSSFRRSDGMLPPEGGTTNVKILDMGLARIDEVTEAQAELTTTGAVMGTVDYMAPEQALSAKFADARSDIYSLGITLWYLLTGRVAYEGDSMMAKLLAHRDSAIPSLVDELRRVGQPAGDPPSNDTSFTKSNPVSIGGSRGLDPPYEAVNSVFRKMVAKRPADRYQSMTEVTRDLERCLTGTESSTISSSGISTSTWGEISNSAAEAETVLLSGSAPKADRRTEPSITLDGAHSQSPNAAHRKNKRPIALLGLIAAVALVALAMAFSGRNPAGQQIGRDESSRESTPAAVTSQITNEAADQASEGAIPSELTAPDFALQFSRFDQRVELPVLELKLEDTHTIEAFVTPANDVVSGTTWGQFINLNDRLKLQMHAKNLCQFDVRLTQPGGEGRLFGAGAVSLLKNRRTHIAGVQTTGDIRFFVDGKLIKVTPIEGKQFVDSPRPALIGGGSGSMGFFEGFIDEVRISSTARYDRDFTPETRFKNDEKTLALYHCDEGNGVELKDSSGHGHHGKVFGAQWVKVDAAPITGVGGGGLWFDGQGDSVLLPELTSRDQPLTIEGWLTLASDKDMSLVTIPHADGAGLFRITVLNKGPQAVVVRNKSLAIAYSRSCTLPLGEPFHLAAVFLGNGRWNFWMNGESLAEGADHYGWSPPINRAFSATVGMDDGVPLSNGQGRGAFHGTLSELRISQTARYTTKFQPPQRLEPDKDTLALYHCDEGGGDVLKDSSGNNSHGKIVGAKWVQAGGSPITAPLATTPTPPRAVAPFDAKQARTHQESWAKHLGTAVETTNSADAKMVLIPPGVFLMGSSDEQIGAIIKEVEELNLGQETIDRILKNERPQHRVILTRPFFLGATEVTIGQFKKFVEATGFQTYAEKTATDDKSRTYLRPGYPVTDDCPASCVAWEEALAYCRWLSDVEKVTYRLPTEAEWEYACRAGTQTLWSWGNDQELTEKFAWTQKDSESRAHSVATKQPNPFGLFDMHGNLSEWCQDLFDETWYAKSPVIDPIPPLGTHTNNARGGAFAHFAITRSAYRTGYTRGDFHPLRGFRVMREIDSPHDQPSADRRAAEWVIAQGGSVMVFGEEKWIVAMNDLPPSGLRLIHVKLGRSLSGADADLVPLRELNNVVTVGMDSSDVSAAGVAGLASIPALEQVALGGGRLGDDRLAALARLKSLKQLHLYAAELTPEQSATLARTMPQLVYLNLGNNRLLGDDALDAFRNMPKLATLELNGTQVTAAGVAALQKSLPNCKIQWDGAGK